MNPRRRATQLGGFGFNALCPQLPLLCLTTTPAYLPATLGTPASRLFIPFFRVSGANELLLPPLLPLVGWDGIAQLGVGLVVATILDQVVVVAVGMRCGLRQVLRMGE